MGFNKLFKREKIYNLVVFKHFQYMTNSIMITDYIKNERTVIYNREIERIEDIGTINNNSEHIYSNADISCNRNSFIYDTSDCNYSR